MASSHLEYEPADGKHDGDGDRLPPRKPAEIGEVHGSTLVATASCVCRRWAVSPADAGGFQPYTVVP